VPGIIISYRREHNAGYARSLLDRLGEWFGKESVFIDIEIEPGADFVDVIEKAIAECDVLLVLISREWADCVDGAGVRRLGKASDFVRQEIAAALRAKSRLIPILIDGAEMPASESLPEDMRALTRRHAVELRHSRWDADVQQLISALEKIVPAARQLEPPARAAQPVHKKLSPVEARIQLSQCSLTYAPETFIRCIQEGDALGVRLFLAAGMDPNTKDRYDTPALYEAAASRRVEILEMLLNAGARVDEKTIGGTTALFSAVESTNTAMFDALREHGADVQKADRNGATALSIRHAWDNGHILQALLEGASVEALNRAFVSAARERRLDVMRLMMDRGARVTDIGSEALLEVVTYGQHYDVTEIVTFLLDLGADVNATFDSQGRSALLIAADYDETAVVTMLLKRGADVNVTCSDDGTTSLHRAASRNHLEIVEALLASGANIHLRDRHGETALHRISTEPIVRALLSRGADVNARDNRGVTPLMRTGCYGELAAVQALLDNGADIHAKDDESMTTLMLVVKDFKFDWEFRVHQLLSSGADVNERNSSGKTALILALSGGAANTAVVRQLLQRGADAAVRDASGMTALDYAEKISDGQTRATIVRLLESAGEAETGPAPVP
jgi:ankyrin repeat protein